MQKPAIARLIEIEELIPTRRSLLSRLKDWDDQESWRTFFDTYWRLIYSAAIRDGLIGAEAQDAVQETIISVLKGMSDFKYRRTNCSFKSWLLQLTSWPIQEQLRKRKPQKPQHHVPEDTWTRTGTTDRIPDPASLEWQRDADWESNLMQAAIQRVKKKADSKHYQIFDLLVFKELSPLRVALMFRVTRARLYLIKHRISKQLKAEVLKLQSEVQLKAAVIESLPTKQIQNEE